MTQSYLAWVSMSGIAPSLPGDVAVYDIRSEKLLAMIPVGIKPGSLAIFPEGKKIYVLDLESSIISVINCDSFAVINTIPVGKGPHAMVLDPTCYKGYAADLAEQTISIIDLQEDIITATIDLDSSPTGLALTKDGKRLYVAHHANYSLSVIDTDQNQVVETFPFHTSDDDTVSLPYSQALSAKGLAFSPDDTHLYITIPQENRIALVNLDLQKEATTIPVGQNPQGIILHPTKPLAYVLNLDSNSISILSITEQNLLTKILLPDVPCDLTLTPDGSQLWVTTDYELILIDTETNEIISTLPAPPSAQVRHGVVYSESPFNSLLPGVISHPPARPYAFALERIYFKPPKPFDLTLHLQFPTSNAKAEGLLFGDAEVKYHSISILPIPLRPNYYYLTFAFRLPYTVFYKDQHNQLQELKDGIHHVLSAVEIHLTPSRLKQKLNLKVATQSEVISKLATPHSLDLTIRTQLVAMQQVHIAE